MNNRYDDLVLHLKLDDIDISTTMLSDSSKSGLKAKVHGASLVEDDTFGACLDFQGQDDHVEVSSVNLTGPNPPHTIGGWIKMKTYPQARAWILLLGQEGTDSHHWLLNSEAAGDLGKKAQLGAWGKMGNQATPIMPVAEWVHVATTYDGSNFVCYLNGQPVDTKQTTFNLTDKARLTLAKRGIATEKNFQGKMAHVRIYRRALSEAEIREDMDTDRLALAAFRRGHPIGFSLRDKDENYVLYIGDDPKDHHNLNLELRNTSAQAIRFKRGEKAADKASGDNHHFELVFRNGVLSDKTLKKLHENKEQVIVSKDAKEQWDLFSPPREDSQTGTISVYLLYKDTSELFGPNEKLTIPLRNISANAGSGARGTRVELKLNQLTYDGETTPITGSRIQHLQIISHLGSRRVPLHVGFVGSNRILNDGSSANTLVLQLMNVLKLEEGDTSVTLTKDSEFRISFDVQSAKEVAPWSLCTEGEIKGVKGSIIVAKTDGRYVVIDQNGNPDSDVGRWKVDSTGHGQGETPVWSIKPRQDIVLGHDDYIQIYISNIKTSLPSGLTNLYLDYRRIPGFWDGQVVCPIEKAPLLFYDVTAKGQTFSFSQRGRDYIARNALIFNDIPLRSYLSSEERDRLVIRLERERQVQENSRRVALQSQKIGLLDGQLKKEAEHFFNEWERLAARSGVQPVAHIPELLAVTASRRYIQLLDNYGQRTLYVSPDLPMPPGSVVVTGAELPRTSLPAETIYLGDRYLRMGTFRRQFLELRLAADMVEIEEDATEPALEGIITREEHWQYLLAEAEKSLPEIAALLNEIETQRAQLQYTGELRVGIGCVKPEAKLEIALSANDADTKPLVIRKDKVNYLTVLKDGKVGIGTSSPQTQLHVGSGSPSWSSSINTDRVNMVVASESKGAGIAIAQKSGVNVVLQAWDHPGSPHGGDGYIGTTSNHSLFLMTNNQQNVVINTDGKVGIGTLNPSAKLSIMGGLNVGGESDPGDKNLLVGGKASIRGGMHVGGESDPGDKNLLVGGKASIRGGLHVGPPLAGHEGLSVDRSLLVNGSGMFLDSLIVRNSIGLLHLGTQNFVAEIAVEPALTFRTEHGGKWFNSATIHPPGTHMPTLAVAGHISETLDLIEVKGRNDWTVPNHPIMKYFSERLTARPVGTMLRAITDLPEWRGHYWQGWVDADRKIRVIHNSIKTLHVAPQD